MESPFHCHQLFFQRCNPTLPTGISPAAAAATNPQRPLRLIRTPALTTFFPVHPPAIVQLQSDERCGPSSPRPGTRPPHCPLPAATRVCPPTHTRPPAGADLGALQDRQHLITYRLGASGKAGLRVIQPSVCVPHTRSRRGNTISGASRALARGTLSPLVRLF
jgi:hypothetical protein